MVKLKTTLKVVKGTENVMQYTEVMRLTHCGVLTVVDIEPQITDFCFQKQLFYCSAQPAVFN